MGILNRDEISRRLAKGELIKNARNDDQGNKDVEPDSYDLTAGTAIWKEQQADKNYIIRTEMCKDGCSPELQPTITVQPGQMIFVVTREQIALPLDVCGTVYSRNNVALEGILALNAGHVDPGYTGPIVIRLINLKATPWTLHLGNGIFTIIFHTIDHAESDNLASGPTYPMDKMLDRVRKTAENSLSNALFDLYANKIDERLNEHYMSFQQKMKDDLTATFIPKDQLFRILFRNVWTWIIAFILVAATVVAAIYQILQYYST